MAASWPWGCAVVPTVHPVVGFVLRVCAAGPAKVENGSATGPVMVVGTVADEGEWLWPMSGIRPWS